MLRLAEGTPVGESVGEFVIVSAGWLSSGAVSAQCPDVLERECAAARPDCKEFSPEHRIDSAARLVPEDGPDSGRTGQIYRARLSRVVNHTRFEEELSPVRLWRQVLIHDGA